MTNADRYRIALRATARMDLDERRALAAAIEPPTAHAREAADTISTDPCDPDRLALVIASAAMVDG